MSDDELPDTHWPLAAALAAEEKLAEEAVVIDVGEVLGITGYFVLASGRNERQVRAIVEEVEQRLGELGGPKPLSIEGREDNVWVLMDYGDFVVHVFEQEARGYYDLDRLWSDRPRVPHHDRAGDAALPREGEQSLGDPSRPGSAAIAERDEQDRTSGMPHE